MYSVKCIKCLQPIGRYLKCWGVIPSYDFDKEKMSKNRPISIYLSIFGFVLIFMLTLYSIATLFYEINKDVIVDTDPINKLCALLYEILGIWCIFSSKYDACTKKDSWEQFFQRIINLEATQNCFKTEDCKNTKFYRIPLFWFVLLNILLLGGYVLHFVIYFPIGILYLSYASQQIFSYENMLMSFTIATVALNLKWKFYFINETLKKSYDSGKEKLNFEEVMKTRKLFLEMAKIVDLFNLLFGRQLFFMPLVCSVQVLHTGLIIALLGQEDKWTYVALHSAYAVFLLLVQFAQMFCCDITMRQSDQILTTCYDIQDQLTVFSPEHEELQDLAEKLRNRRIRFSALNYFDVDRSTMFAMIANTVTYFVALVQFTEKPATK